MAMTPTHPHSAGLTHVAWALCNLTVSEATEQGAPLPYCYLARWAGATNT